MDTQSIADWREILDGAQEDLDAAMKSEADAATALRRARKQVDDAIVSLRRAKANYDREQVRKTVRP